MAKQKRSILDDVAEQLGKLLNDLERLITTGRRKPVRVPVPIPVQDEDPRRPRRDPYR